MNNYWGALIFQSEPENISKIINLYALMHFLSLVFT